MRSNQQIDAIAFVAGTPVAYLAGDLICQASPEVAKDETTEQVFSRKDRKAYRQAVEQRTEAKPTITRRKKKALGEEVKARSKARS